MAILYKKGGRAGKLAAADTRFKELKKAGVTYKDYGDGTYDLMDADGNAMHGKGQGIRKDAGLWNMGQEDRYMNKQLGRMFAADYQNQQDTAAQKKSNDETAAAAKPQADTDAAAAAKNGTVGKNTGGNNGGHYVNLSDPKYDDIDPSEGDELEIEDMVTTPKFVPSNPDYTNTVFPFTPKPNVNMPSMEDALRQSNSLAQYNRTDGKTPSAFNQYVADNGSSKVKVGEGYDDWSPAAARAIADAQLRTVGTTKHSGYGLAGPEIKPENRKEYIDGLRQYTSQQMKKYPDEYEKYKKMYQTADVANDISYLDYVSGTNNFKKSGYDWEYRQRQKDIKDKEDAIARNKRIVEDAERRKSMYAGASRVRKCGGKLSKLKPKRK